LIDWVGQSFQPGLTRSDLWWYCSGSIG